MKSKNLQNTKQETEILSADEQKIIELISGLEKVSAPKDFNFRVKAKIAGEQGSYTTASRHWLRYVLPVGASASVLALGLYATNFFAPAVPSEQVNNVEPAVKVEKVREQPIEIPQNRLITESNTAYDEEFPANSSVQNSVSPKPPAKETILIADRVNPKKAESKPVLETEDNFNGTRDISLKEKKLKIYSRGIEPDKSVPQAENIENSNKTNDVEMLNLIGVEVSSEAGKMRVRAVRQNTVAERSGVKTGDIIESFGEQKTEGNSNPSNLGGAKKLVVSRDGKLITFELRLD